VDHVKAFTEFWTAQGQSFLQVQQQAGKAIADGMQALASGTMPEVSAETSAAAADLGRATQSVTALWSAATELSAALMKMTPAGAASPDPTTPADAAARDATVEATFRNMIDPHHWMAGLGEMDEVLGRMAEGPRLADLWEVERRYARVLQAWMVVRRRNLEHNAVVLEAWLKAGRQFGEELAGLANSGEQPPDAKATLALWTETANKQLLETQHAEPFLVTQAAVIRATTDLRIAQQELVEYFGNQYGFPTRTELDDVHRSVTEMRRELRAMRREQQKLAASLEAASAPPPVLPQPPAPVTDRSAATPPTRRQAPRQRGAR
jgi:polyhydroxyalkanoate synthase subunit PhaE